MAAEPRAGRTRASQPVRGMTEAAERQHPDPALCVGRLRADVRPADFRLYGAAGVECRVPAAEGGMGADRRAAGSCQRRRRPHGRTTDLPAVAACGPLGPGQKPDRHGGPVEPGDLALRGRRQLSADAGRPSPRRCRRSGLWQRRHRRRDLRLSQAAAGDPVRSVHGRRACWARCLASASVAPIAASHGWRMAFLAIAWSASRWPSFTRSWSASGGSATSPGRRCGSPMSESRVSENRQPVCRPDPQMRLYRQRAAVVRCGRVARVAADLFQPLLRPSSRQARHPSRPCFSPFAGSAWWSAA